MAKRTYPPENNRFDREAFDKALRDRSLVKRQVAEMLGLTIGGLYRRLQTKSWTLTGIDEVIDKLKLTDDEVKQIFFSEEKGQ